MTPRENLIHFFRNEAYEWTPTSMDQMTFRPEFIPDHVARGMVAQQTPYKGSFGGKDLFGVDWIYEESASGSMEAAPLLDDLEEWREKLVFPNLDEMDWEKCAKENADYLNTDKLIQTTIYTGFFERLISLVGFEEAAIALVAPDLQEEVVELFDKLADFYIAIIKKFHQYFNVEFVEIHDDWGTQKSTIFSADTHREFIMPFVKKVVDAAHADGIFVEQHSCGHVEPLFPNIIASGVDTWRGQENANDKKKLVETYGDRFKFSVEIRPAAPVDDAAAMALAENVINTYRGKNVILTLGRTLAPHQKAAIYEKIKSIGKI